MQFFRISDRSKGTAAAANVVPSPAVAVRVTAARLSSSVTVAVYSRHQFCCIVWSFIVSCMALSLISRVNDFVKLSVSFHQPQLIYWFMLLETKSLVNAHFSILASLLCQLWPEANFPLDLKIAVVVVGITGRHSNPQGRGNHLYKCFSLRRKVSLTLSLSADFFFFSPPQTRIASDAST